MAGLTPGLDVLAHSKSSTRVALVGLDESQSAIISDCFKQFKILTVPIHDDPAGRLRREKFEGCVLRLTSGSEDLLKAARQSPSNRLMVLYGIVNDPREAMQFSGYGINAILSHPVERAAALKMVRATYLLAINEFRRYVRVPVVIEVALESEGRTYSGVTQEISSGGMSLDVPEVLEETLPVVANFTMPGAKWISVRALVCWTRKESKMIGLRFDRSDKGRTAVRQWIENFLDAHI